MATTTTNTCTPSVITPTPHQTNTIGLRDEVDELVSQRVPYAVDLGSEWKVEWKPCEVAYGTDFVDAAKGGTDFVDATEGVWWKPHVIALCDNPSNNEWCMWAKGSELTTQQRDPEPTDLGQRWEVRWEPHWVEHVSDGIYESTIEWIPHVIAVCNAYDMSC